MLPQRILLTLLSLTLVGCLSRAHRPAQHMPVHHATRSGGHVLPPPGYYVPGSSRAHRHSLVDLFSPAGTRIAALLPGMPAAAGLPAAVDHRGMGLGGTIKHEGRTAFADDMSFASAVEKQLLSLKHEWLRDRSLEISALHVRSKDGLTYTTTREYPYDDGRVAFEREWPYDERTACKYAQKFDSCTKVLGVEGMSYRDDPDVQRAVAHADWKARVKVTRYERIEHTDGDAIARYLAAGDAVWLGIAPHDNWHRLQGDAIPHYDAPHSDAANGTTVALSRTHNVVLAGYRTLPTGRQFLVQNNWGTAWGDAGYAWIDERTLVQNAWRAHKIHVYVLRERVTPPEPRPQLPRTQPPATRPAPPPLQLPAIASPCASGQAVDPVFGQCRPLCANGYPSAAGVCLPVSLPTL